MIYFIVQRASLLRDYMDRLEYLKRKYEDQLVETRTYTSSNRVSFALIVPQNVADDVEKGVRGVFMGSIIKRQDGLPGNVSRILIVIDLNQFLNRVS